MVIKLYISGISGNKEVKKKQQRVQMILDSKQITYEAIDITEPGKEKDKEFMQQNGKVRECLGKYPLPPQIFNDDDFCGDYEDFDLANEVDELEKFLHIATSPKILENESKQSEDCDNISENSFRSPSVNPYEYHTIKIKWDPVNGHREEIIESTGGENAVVNDSEQVEENKSSEELQVNGVIDDVTTSNENDNETDTKTSNGDIAAPVNEDMEKEEETKEERKSNVENGDKESSQERTEDDNNDVSSPAEDGKREEENGNDEEREEKMENSEEREEEKENGEEREEEKDNDEKREEELTKETDKEDNNEKTTEEISKTEVGEEKEEVEGDNEKEEDKAEDNEVEAKKKDEKDDEGDEDEEEEEEKSQSEESEEV